VIITDKRASTIKKAEGDRRLRRSFRIKDKGNRVPIKIKEIRMTKIILIINKNKEILIIDNQF
jgi:hypothetical protein